MSHKLSKKNKTEMEYTELIREVIEYLLAAVLIILCVVVPLYARDGYHQIGNAKFEAYRRIMIGGFGVLLMLTAAYFMCRVTGRRLSRGGDAVQPLHSGNAVQLSHRGNAVQPSHGGNAIQGVQPHKVFPEGVSGTDLFVFAYLLLAGASVVSGGFYEDALWGAFGWNMGFLTQVSFVLLYLYLSRFGKYYRAMLWALCLAATVVFGIGILHRLMIDPVGFYDGLTNDQKAQFLSTLGQATWYGAFLAVTLPVGMGIFLYTAQTKRRVIAGIYMLIGFCTLVTQNSDSAYFALAGMLIVFFMVSCEKRELLCRFTAMLTMFFAAGKIMYLLTRIRSNPALEPDFITQLMWTSGLTWGLLLLCLAATLMLHGSGAKGVKTDAGASERPPVFSPVVICRLRRGVVASVFLLIVTVVLLICLQSRGVLPAGIAEKMAAVSYLNWSDDWGNGRGRIWKFAWSVFAREDMRHRLFGVGPDCFNSYVMAYHGEEASLFWGEKMLTNAHNEWFTILINGGIFGAAAYAGIYVTAVVRFLRGRGKDLCLLTGIGAAVVSYMCYNFFCYQQVLCTPFIFILLGIGEYILRQKEA